MVGDGWNKRIARGEASSAAYQQLVAGLRGTILGCLDVIGFYMATSARGHTLEAAVAYLIEALLDFDERCAAGDVEGAVVQLRAVIRRYREHGGGSA